MAKKKKDPSAVAESRTAKKQPAKASSAKNRKATLDELLALADKAYSVVVKRYYELGCIYVQVLTQFGDEGKRAFRVRFPLTENALRNLELVGRQKLLPQFIFCSNNLTSGLAKMDKSIERQYKLLGSSNDGYVRVRTADGFKEVKFEDFTGEMTDVVLTILAEEDESLGVDKLAEKLAERLKDVRCKFKRRPVKDYEFRATNGVHTVRFNRVRGYSVAELRKILELLEAASASTSTADSAASSGSAES